ncbi:hypothetical protein V6N13_004121 [Hibiscus sabdariffa]
MFCAEVGLIFPAVDPILIPGPPGSFLPSPRHMDSDDLQGNASSSTGRIQSCNLECYTTKAKIDGFDDGCPDDGVELSGHGVRDSTSPSSIRIRMI